MGSGMKPRRWLSWELVVFGTRLRNRIQYVLKVPRVFRNWWAWPLPKLGVDAILELRNGLRFSVRGGTDDLAALNEGVISNPYLGSGHIELRQDSVVMDLGANMGDFTIIAAARCPRGRVYAVEPLSEYIPVLQTNVALNHLSNVEIIQVAIGDHEGEVAISVAGVQSSIYFDSGTKRETVRITTIPQLMRDHRIDRIDLLKMDCEGAEWEILPAAREVLTHVKQICMEFHPARGWTAEKLAAFLRESGYEVWYTESGWNGSLWARRARYSDPESRPLSISNSASWPPI
ncbi:MAG: FkbM family methyltransferase [Candidatus Binatus sp.]|uniref:FkbM family methyltransferase n=1 Tax=Candidatus Binatus sp. TaxID=2811406 RepID=UPI003BB20741